ncbi:MAG: DUF2723 domain-containing protein [Proteobacteria bacterium]|nr:DUF2723 domain-containing protein [Pseudomonadota bacterium]
MKTTSMKHLAGNGNKSKGLLFALGILLVILYAWTGPRGTTPEDASEFILTAFFRGLPHPPGYPLFVWLGHLCSYLPGGSPAQRIAFLSELCIAASAVVWGLWSLSLFQNTLLAAWVTLTFGLSLPIWSSAQLVEVYPLHTFLLTLTFFLAFKMTQSEENLTNKGLFFFFGLTLGLGLANHYPLVVLAFPALAALFYPFKDKIFRLTQLICVLSGLGLGLLPYLHLWFVHHYSDFTFSGPLQSTSDFFDYLLRKEYANNDRSKVFSFRELGLYSWVGLKMLFGAFSPLVFLAALLGSKRFLQKCDSITFPLALILGTLSSFLLLFFFWQPDFYRLAIELFETFHGFALGCFLLFATNGIWFLINGKATSQTSLRVLFLVPVFLFLTNFKPLDRRTDTFTKDYASLILDSLPPQSLLLVKGDADAGIIAYAHFLENKRPDISVVSQVAALLPKKPFDRATDIPKNQHQIALLNLISAHLAIKRPVFSIGPVEYFSPQTSPFPLKTKNYGLFQEIYETDPPPQRDFSSLISKESDFLDKVIAPSFEPNFQHYRNRTISDVCHALLVAGGHHQAFDVLPRCLWLKAQWLHVEKRDFETADKLFLKAIEGSQLSQNSELADMGKDFLLNRLKILETYPEMDSLTRKSLLEETFRVTLPIALDFKTCKNNLAPRLLRLAVSSGFEKEANALRNAFSDCNF